MLLAESFLELLFVEDLLANASNVDEVDEEELSAEQSQTGKHPREVFRDSDGGRHLVELIEYVSLFV